MDIREIALLVTGFIFFVFLSGLKSLRFGSSDETAYELARRAKAGSEAAKRTLQQQRMLPDILTFRQTLAMVSTILVVICLVNALGWFLGIIISLVALLEVGMLASQKQFAAFAQRLYERYENSILGVVVLLRPGLRLVRDVSETSQSDFNLHSKEELLHLISEAKLILTENERYMLEHAMQFETKNVSEIMTPRSIIETVDAKEILGPVVLDRLHKSGHSRFPVIQKDLDHVVGLLYVHDLFSLARNTEKSSAQKLMEAKVYYINENQPLPSALAGFLQVRHHLFIVVNEFEETTGVITIEDVLEALIGRKIVDEFDQYDDLRAVAKRAATLRNKSGNSTHIQ